MIEDGFSLDDVREYLNTVQTEEHFTNDRISRTLRNIQVFYCIRIRCIVI